MVLEDGLLLDPLEDIVETGSSLCSATQEPRTENNTLTVINEQEAEVNQIVGDIIENLLCDIVK